LVYTQWDLPLRCCSSVSSIVYLPLAHFVLSPSPRIESSLVTSGSGAGLVASPPIRPKNRVLVRFVPSIRGFGGEDLDGFWVISDLVLVLQEGVR
jgi:hypothetical protein